ncbi:AI-2E family transporter [Oceanomicrobium pacificus]|uniref:AI-2E family transporter n=1 Tax=Oceanomicrobium pacificus TaxID=2692916 RepID=A0A6B0TQ51_9RHOB|nr:AI-2E family transporter [Oceanomicrobium pacificus]MXU63918.1 AI-2E family transporter [Oceanomicrobium pacificus]
MSDGPKRNLFAISVLVAVTLAFLIILTPFWKSIFWAAVFGILFRGAQERLAARMNGGRNRAAGFLVAVILFCVLLPALLLVGLIAGSALNVYENLQNGQLDPAQFLQRVSDVVPRLASRLEPFGIEIDQLLSRLSEVALKGSQFALSLLVNVGENAAIVVVQIFLMLYLLFFVLRDGPSMFRSLFDAVPLPHAEKERFFNQFATVSIATIKGTVVVGAVQGTLGGIAFAVLGIDGAVFWGAVMALISVLPAFGATLIWAPAAIILMATGDWMKGLILLAFGTFVISMVDNVLRPILVGRDTQMPDYLVLFTTLGGLSLIGLTGFVVGPVIASLFLVSWSMFAARNAQIEAAGGMGDVTAGEGSSDNT